MQIKNALTIFMCIFSEKVCPNITIDNSVDTQNKAGEFGDSHAVRCITGHRLQGEDNNITTFITTCNNTKQWNVTRPCESKF